MANTTATNQGTVGTQNKKLADDKTTKSGVMAETFSGISERASDLAASAGDRVSSVKETVGRKLETVAEQILEHTPQDGRFTSVATGLASGVETAGNYIRTTELSEIGKTMASVIRKYPLQSVLVGLGFGVAINRFFKRS